MPPSSQPGAEQPDPLGLRELAQLMSSSDPEDQAAAAQGLAYLVLTEQTDPAAASQAGCLGGLMALLDSSSSEVQEQAACALATLASHAADSTTVIAVPGCLEGLVAALGSSCVGVQKQAARALASLALVSAETSAAVAAAHGCLTGLCPCSVAATLRCSNML